MKSSTRQQGSILQSGYLPIVVVGVGTLLISYLIGSDRYTQRVILLIFIWAAASCSFNIISGYGGQTVFGYMMFVGTGAYTTVFLFKFLHVSPWFGMLIGAVIAAVIAFFIGLPTLRLRGVFFAMATIAFPLIAFAVLSGMGYEEVIIPFSGRDPLSLHFTDMRSYVVIAVVLLVGILILTHKIETSRFGYALKAIRQNETAAEGMGVDTFRVKLIAFMLSAALGAIIGTIYSYSCLFVLTTHAVFGLFIVVRILAISSVGGLGTLWGPVIASAILIPIGEYLNAQLGDRLPGLSDVIYGAALIGAIIYMPEGIWGKISNAFKQHRKSVPATELIPTGTSSLTYTDPQGSEGVAISSLSGSFEKKDGKNDNRGAAPILKVVDISKSFGGVEALKNVSFEVPRGKILGIIGPNGAGKTTLFNVIHGYLRPENGKVFFDGEDTHRLKPHDLCRRGVGRTFQVAQIFQNLKVVENIMIGAFAVESSADKAWAIAEETATMLGFTRRLNDYATGLTIWETKMLEFARALSARPRLLLVDEPMAGLNPEENHQIGETIKAISKAGITVIVIEHVVQSLVKISDLMVGLDQGKKVIEGTPDEVVSNPHMVEGYLGAKWKERYAKR
jgi:branched-chain amino acid transport system permease protein